MFERVLVPVELGKSDELVLAFVQGMARYGVSDVILVHSARSRGMERAVALRREAGRQVRIDRLGASLEDEGVAVKRFIGSGDPAEETLAAADRDDVTLIVAGTSSKSAIDEITEGSTSEVIGRRADVPVLLLPFSLLDQHTPEDSRGHGAALLDSVVFATDFSDVSERCLEAIKTFPANAVGTVHVTHVTSPPDEADRDGYSVLALKRTTNAIAAELEESGINARPNLVFGASPQGVLDAAVSNAATCIAVGAHVRGLGGEMLLGSFSQAVIRKSPIPVLITH